MLTQPMTCEWDSHTQSSRAKGFVLEQAHNRLATSSHRLLRSVHCDFDGEVLSVHGRLPSFYLKQLVQSLLGGLDGVHRIDNRVAVVSAFGRSSVPGE
jgi:hypothetical protein